MASFVQNFKVVSEKSASAKHPKGSKRKPVTITYADPVVTQESQIHVLFAVNELIQSFAKARFAEESDDWDFVPSVLNLQAAYDYMTVKVSKTREVTALTLKAFGDWYYRQAQVLLNKSEKAAAAGNIVIQKKLFPIMGNNDSIKAFAGNLVALADAIVAKEDERLEEEFLSHAAVFDWLNEKLAEAITVSSDDL